MSAQVSVAAKLLGARVRRFRETLGCNQEELANRATVNVSNLGRIERGRANPSLITIVLIAGALHVDPAELVGGISSAMLGGTLQRDGEQSPAETESGEPSTSRQPHAQPSQSERNPAGGRREISDHGGVVIGRRVR